MRYRKFSPAALLLAAGIAACSTTDPSNQVSVDDYRATLLRIRDDVSKNLVPKIERMRDDDLSSPRPRHRPEWWSATVGLARDVAQLASDVAAGAAVSSSSR